MYFSAIDFHENDQQTRDINSDLGTDLTKQLSIDVLDVNIWNFSLKKNPTHY